MAKNFDRYSAWDQSDESWNEKQVVNRPDVLDCAAISGSSSSKLAIPWFFDESSTSQFSGPRSNHWVPIKQGYNVSGSSDSRLDIIEPGQFDCKPDTEKNRQTVFNPSDNKEANKRHMEFDCLRNSRIERAQNPYDRAIDEQRKCEEYFHAGYRTQAEAEKAREDDCEDDDWGIDIVDDSVDETDPEVFIQEIRMTWLKGDHAPSDGLVFLAKDRNQIFVNPHKVKTYCVGRSWLLTDLSRDYKIKLFLPFPGISRYIPYGTFGNVVQCQRRGQSEYERDVYEIVDGSTGIPLRAGLTIHSGYGSWSAWPPHGFEIAELRSPISLYPKFSEQFAFITLPARGWGLQVNVEAGVENSYHDTVVPIKDGMIRDVSLGSHPVVAMPGVKLAYFWAYTEPNVGDGSIEKFRENK